MSLADYRRPFWMACSSFETFVGVGLGLNTGNPLSLESEIGFTW